MTTETYDTVHAKHPTTQLRRGRRRWWTVVTTALAAAVFAEAVFAGAMLSGLAWGRTAHRATAIALIASASVAGLIAMIRLRRIPHGPNLGLSLWGLAFGLCVQAALGGISAHGTNVMWLHVPLGVALVGFAMQGAARARKLDDET